VQFEIKITDSRYFRGSTLIGLLKSYELYRSAGHWRDNYTNRYMFIKKVFEERHPYPGLFRSDQEVLKLVERQMAAYNKAATNEPGWQSAMKEAGIWDE
jgi:hypothetical protein